MVAHRNGRAPGNRLARPALTPEEAEAQFHRALIWREAWRAEKARAAAPMVRGGVAEPAVRPDDQARRARFAESVARAAFGRAYWDERKERGTRPEASNTGGWRTPRATPE